MCIAAFAFGRDTGYRLAFAANRDELHSRPSAPADWWDDPTTILGGRDLLAGGSWLAIDRRGRLAAVTNLPQDHPRPFPRSRGRLVHDFLSDNTSARNFAARFVAASGEFGPCNLLVWDAHELHYAGTGIGTVRLEPGIHALGNAPLGADGPRTRRAEAGMRESLANDDPEAALLIMLANGSTGPAESADTALARRRTEIFIKNPHYGTRCSTVVLITTDGRVRFTERSFAADGSAVDERRHTFEVDQP